MFYDAVAASIMQILWATAVHNEPDSHFSQCGQYLCILIFKPLDRHAADVGKKRSHIIQVAALCKMN